MVFGSAPTILIAGVAACGLAGLLFLVASARRLGRRRYGACAVHGLASLALFFAAAVVALLGLNLLTYDRLTREQPVLRASFAQTAPQHYNATLVYPSGQTRGYVLGGDEWQIDPGDQVACLRPCSLRSRSPRTRRPLYESSACHTAHGLCTACARTRRRWQLCGRTNTPGVEYGSAIGLPCRGSTTKSVCRRSRQRPKRRGSRRNDWREYTDKEAMNQETFNLSIRKFLKMVGINSQREIEQAVAKAMAGKEIAGTKAFLRR